jgi:kumamolisin
MLGAILFLATATWSGAQGPAVLTGHVLPQVRGARRLGRTPAGDRVSLSLVVRLDQGLLDRTLAQIYGPGAPAQRRYLSPAQFAQTFDLADKRRRLKDFAASHGLAVDADDQPTSVVVKVAGPAAAVESAFAVQLNQYQLGGQEFRAHETEPTIPAELTPHLGAVLGLSNLSGLHKPNLRFPVRGAAPLAAPGASRPATLTGTGPGGGLAPADIRTVYGLSGALNGAGQTAAVFELDGYAASDIALYESQFGLPSVPLTFIGVDGTGNTLLGGNSDIEVALDIELMIALAPHISNILVYDGPNTGQGVVDTYAKIASDDLAPTISSSWGIVEASAAGATVAAENTIFQQMALQGQTIYVASGDDGSKANGTSLSVQDPSSQPYATGVGGTSLSGTISPLSVVETTWNTGANGGGGGVSTLWPLPSYQTAIPGEFSTTNRNVPDVSLNADPNSAPYSICEAGSCSVLVGGTSAAAPLWASLTVLINQKRLAGGSGPFGFANPSFYTMGTGGASLPYSSLFNDITTGNNGTAGSYDAGVGYDDATGWGSFQANNMITGAFPAAVAAGAPTVTAVYSSSVTLSWSANGNVSWTGYSVSYWDYAVNAATTTVPIAATTVATLTGLIPNDTYFITVAAVGSGGLAPSGVVVSTLTKPTVPVTTSIGSAGGALSFNTGNPNNTLITLNIPPGAFTTNVGITISGVGAGALPGPVSAAETLAATGVAAQIDLSPLIEPVRNVTMSMTYPASATAGLTPSRFVLARFDTTANTWVPLTSSLSGNTVTAVSNHLSMFQIMQAAASSSVSSAKAFPNPMRAVLGESTMSFVQLPPGARVRIYAETGVLVRELSADSAGMLTWDGNDKNGGRVASGVYFVYAQSGGERRTFKVAVER